jgi:hypothetical protein
LLLSALAHGCGGEGTATPDAGPPAVDAAPPDGFPACDEFASPVATITTLPAALEGDLAGAGDDLLGPDDCAVIDAPFGMASIGADAVIELAGLTAGVEYVVRLDAPDDLAFYVATGCGSAAGPTDEECLLYVDATTELAEVGRFTAPDGPAYVVVDYWAADEPETTSFTLEVYEVGCETAAGCTAGETPVCQDFRCVGCSNDFDCTDDGRPLCDEPTFTCVPGYSQCAGDDLAAEAGGDDGPAGATALGPGAAIGANICNNPSTERDFYRFQVTQPGEHWTISLAWGAAVDLDLVVFDSEGELLGMSFYEEPEVIETTYLPAGTYYAMVDYFSSSQTSLSTPYTISATRITGDACSSPADCAAEFRNQVFRGDCVGGACQRIDGNGQRDVGERCDSDSDCVSAANCASFYFVADADDRMVCGNYCDSDADCAGLGPSFVCTTYLSDNFCVEECLIDAHCPTVPTSYPDVPPWLRFTCQTSTGRCLPP